MRFHRWDPGYTVGHFDLHRMKTRRFYVRRWSLQVGRWRVLWGPRP
jgi:hypothetical protein